MEATLSGYERGKTTLEDLWEFLRKSSEEFDKRNQESIERHKEIDRQMQETDRRMQETDRRMQETDRQMKETDRKMKELHGEFGNLGNSYGELAENMVKANIMEKFNALGFHFTQTCENIVIRDRKTGDILTEIDILLENGDIGIAVEVKAKLVQRDVKKHVQRMEILREAADFRRDTRTFQGAVAGAIMSKEVRDYALKAGFYVIQQSGDVVKIDIPKDFKPRLWNANPRP